MLSFFSTAASYGRSLVLFSPLLTLKVIIQALDSLSCQIVDDDRPATFDIVSDPAWDDVVTPCLSESPSSVDTPSSLLVVEAPSSSIPASEDSDSESDHSSPITLDFIFSATADLEAQSDASSDAESIAAADDLKAPAIPLSPILPVPSSTLAIASPLDPTAIPFAFTPSSSTSSDDDDDDSEEDLEARFVSFRPCRTAPRSTTYAHRRTRSRELLVEVFRYSIYEINMARWAAESQRAMEAEWEREHQWLLAEREYYAAYGMVPYYAVEEVWT